MQFIDLQRQYQSYREEIRAEIDKVLDTSRYILGPAVTELEQAMAAYLGVKQAIGCASGTDALLLAMMAMGIKPGDEVIVPDFTFFATAEMVSLLGAKPVFADVLPDTLNIDPRQVEAKITARTRGVIAVSLYGQCADFDELVEIAHQRRLFLVEDAAQSFGATYKGRKSGRALRAGHHLLLPRQAAGRLRGCGRAVHQRRRAGWPAAYAGQPRPAGHLPPPPGGHQRAGWTRCRRRSSRSSCGTSPRSWSAGSRWPSGTTPSWPAWFPPRR